MHSHETTSSFQISGNCHRLRKTHKHKTWNQTIVRIENCYILTTYTAPSLLNVGYFSLNWCTAYMLLKLTSFMLIKYTDTLFFFCWKGRLIHRRRLVHLAASRRRAARTVEPVGEHVYKTLFLYSVRSSRNPVRRLPFETDTVRNM